MFHYAKFLPYLLVVSFETNAKPLEDTETAPNLFNIHGLSENNAPGAVFMEGDIALPLKTGRTAYTRVPRWPDGIVPVDFDSAYTIEQKNIIIGAMIEIMNKTNNCIRFVWKNADSKVWLRIYPGKGCWSYMGKTALKNNQDVSLQIPGCIHNSVALHELMHSLGFVHEQTRPDRNQYVQIETKNIIPGHEQNFNVFSGIDVNMLNQPYDLGSIMHYKNDAFSSNGHPTIVINNNVDKQWESTMGRGTHMSDLDVKKLKEYYSCP